MYEKEEPFLIKTDTNINMPGVYYQTVKHIIKEWIMLLNNRYLLHDNIGRGLMVNTYHGIDTYTDQSIAIKILKEVYTQDPKFIKRFKNEAKVISSLQHPNIVQVYDYVQVDTTYYMVMELIEGTDLRRYIRSRGILDTENAVKIAYNVALGLGVAHRRGIVHRNVKPTNILLGRDGSIKLTGFSLARVYGMSREELSTTGMSLNIVPYYSPEQAQGETVTPAADVYCLGSVMYQMLTDHPPFEGDSPVAIALQHFQEVPKLPSQFNPTIPMTLEEIIMRCLEKEPERRYSDGSQLAQALETLM
jgi:eukaryotic-like serine/threonine-protein kinase